MLSVNRISANPYFTAQTVSQPQPQSQAQIQTKSQTTNPLVTKPANDKTDKNLSPKAKVAIGAGLAAIVGIGVGIGIAAATKGRAGAKLKNSTDIIEEGEFYGKKFKYIKDAKTGRTKESIHYNENGTESSHSWYDSNVDTKNPEDALIKDISYDKNGNINCKIIYGAPGKKSRHIQYNNPGNVQKYGFKIFSGAKYYPNGNIKFTMTQCPGLDMGLARMYDIDGNVIRERPFYTPQGLAKAKAQNNVRNLTELTEE